jgi:hypothetical protein
LRGLCAALRSLLVAEQLAEVEERRSNQKMVASERLLTNAKRSTIQALSLFTVKPAIKGQSQN